MMLTNIVVNLLWMLAIAFLTGVVVVVVGMVIFAAVLLIKAITAVAASDAKRATKSAVLRRSGRYPWGTVEGSVSTGNDGLNISHTYVDESHPDSVTTTNSPCTDEKKDA